MHVHILDLERKIRGGTLTEHDVKSSRQWGKGFSFKNLPKEEQGKFNELMVEAEKLVKSGGLMVVEVASRRSRPGQSGRQGMSGRQTQGNNSGAASAECIGYPFHNPYTFIPFSDKVPERGVPTARTADEMEKERFSGVLRLKLETLAPLITCEAEAYSGGSNSHKSFHALTVGEDVVLPASGVRGALRTLMTIITGGTLGYMDEELWLCQGRDAQLGPRGPRSPATVPINVFIAKVIKAGDALRGGIVELGMLSNCLTEPEKYRQTDERRPLNGEVQVVTDSEGVEIKLSGRPIRGKGHREGRFIPSGKEIHLPPELWRAYMGRNRHGDFPKLKDDWLVWLEPVKADLKEINSHKDVKSIQWARWGRKGQSMLEALQTNFPWMIPDSMNSDGKVDMVTDLFGLVPLKEGAASSFAGRIRPANLVFKGGKSKLLHGVTLAPLMAPHPGCVAFYRDNSNKDSISQLDKLRGYKVYRTTEERGAKAPWQYATQPIYNKTTPEPPQQKCNKTVDMLSEGVSGTLELALYGLSTEELTLLLHVCSSKTPWRLGGGKPFGLGHCKVTEIEMVDEYGTRHEMSLEPLSEEWGARLELYRKSQIPIQKLRYPRALKNETMAGHQWFARHATPKKTITPGGVPAGLEVVWTDGELSKRAGDNSQIAAQTLPRVEGAPSDFLYGYDCGEQSDVADDRRTLVSDLNPSVDQPGRRGKQPNTSQSRDTRRNWKHNR